MIGERRLALLLWFVCLLAGKVLGAPSPDVAFPYGHAAHPTRVLGRIRTEFRRPEGARWLAEATRSQLVFESTLVPGLVILDTAPGRSAGPSALPQPAEDRTPALLKALKDLEATGWVEFVEPDYFVKSTGSPTEPGLGSGLLWGLRNTGAGGGLAGVDIGADAAWQTTTGSSNVVVAVIDSGIQSNHPDLAANIWRNEKEIPGNGLDDDGNGHIDDYLGVDLVSPGQPISDPDGHGTHVAGTIAAVGNGGGSAVGVAWGAKVLPIRVLDADGKGTYAQIIQGFEYAAKSAAQPGVVNASLGGRFYSEASLVMLRYLSGKGILVVCAAGNDSENTDETPHFPSSYRLPNVLSVAAVRRDGALADFSNYGAESVHVAAPGEDIFSTSPVSSYQAADGTSMAAPHVSGVAALILSIYPDASMVELRQRILQSCLPLPMLGNKVVTGGMVRADRALRIGPDGNPEFELIPQRARAFLAQVSNAVEVVVSDVLPLGGGTLQIRVGTSPAAILKDDGVVPDRVAGDGVYAGTLSGLASGASAIRYELTRAGRVWSSERLIQVDPQPANNAFADRVRLASAETVTTGTLAGATLESGEPGYSASSPRRSVWYQWAVPAGVPDVRITAAGLDCEPELDVFTGITLTSLKAAPAQVLSTGTIAAVVLSGVPNQILQIRVSSTDTIGGRFRLAVQGSGLRPLNDNRVAALPILGQASAGITEKKTASSDAATREVGEPAHAGVTGGRSLWWKFTAPVSGVLECKTRGSDFDTLLAVYPAGSAIALAGNDDYGWGAQWSRVTVEVQAGQTYDIAVDGYKGASGGVVLTATFIPGTNDDFGAATELTAGQTITGNNFGAGIEETFEPVPKVPVGAPSWRAGRSVWYKWTAPSGGRARVIITPRNSGLNLKAAVYYDRARQQTLNFFSNLRTLMSQADVSTAGGAILDIPFDAAAGQEYRISVDGLYYTPFLFGDAWEQGYFDIVVELTTEIGLIYRTEFEVNWEGLLSPGSALNEATFTTPGIWDSGAVRMTQSGDTSSGWAYPFERLDGYGPLTARMSFRMDGTVPAAGWFIGFTSRPLASGGSTLSDRTAISGIVVDGAGIDSAVLNYQSGLASTNPLPRLGTNQRHFVELTMDGSVGRLTAAVDNLLPRSVPFTLAGSRNLLAGPYFIGTPGAGSLVIDNLEIRAAPMALGIQVPFVRSQPTGKNLATGDTLVLEGLIGGEGLSYQWFYQGQPLAPGPGISGTQGTRLTLTGVTVSNAGPYRLVASNSVGQVTTTEAMVTVGAAPAFVSTPVSQTVFAGQPAAFRVVVSGVPAPSYAWFRNGLAIPGANLPTLVFQTVSRDDAASYQVVASNSVGSITSAPVTLTVLLRPPSFTTTPRSQTVIAGQTATLRSLAFGSPTPVYAWFRNNVPIPGANLPNLALQSVSANDAATYYVVASNLAGSITSAPVSLTVLVPPSFVATPTNLSVLVGQPAVFTSSAIGTEPLAYQWLRNDLVLAGRTEASLAFDAVTTNDIASYRVVVSNAAGSITSAPVSLTVQPPPLPGPTNVVWSVAGVGSVKVGAGDLVVAQGNGLIGLRGKDGVNYWRLSSPPGFGVQSVAATAEDGAVVVNGIQLSDQKPCWMVYDWPASGMPTEVIRGIDLNSSIFATVGDSRQRRFVTTWGDGAGVYEVGKGLLWQKAELGPSWNRMVPLERALIAAYYNGDEYGVAAYDYTTGDALWRWRFWEAPQVVLPGLQSLVWAGSGTVLVNLDRRLVALDSSTGAERWRVERGLESNGILMYDAETVIGKMSNLSWTYAWRRATGEPLESPFILNQPLGLWDARLLDNGAILARDTEYGGGAVRWQMPAGSSQSLVGVTGSGRVIYQGGEGVLFAVAGSGSPLSRRSPSPAPVGTFHIPGSKGYLDADLTALRPARGLAVVRNGGVAEIDVFDPGVGYTNRAPISIVGGGGTGAVAEALMKDGGVWSVTVRNPGNGYTNAPVIRFGPPAYPARVAVAEPQIVNGFIVGVTVKDGGWGYLRAPVVRFEGGSGRGATAVARIDAEGQVTAIDVEESGLGYTVAPTVWIEPPLLPTPELAVTRGTWLQFDGLSVGSSYRLQSETAGWQDVGDAFVAGGSSVGFHAATERAHRLVRLPMPQTAAGTLTVVNGFVVGVTVTEPGSGYAEAPQVVVEDPAGRGARVVATVEAGRVSGATIAASGRGYTGGAVVRFASPPVAALVPMEIPELRIQYSNVSTSLPYQLHAGSSLDALQPVGEVFTPATGTGLLYRDMNREHELIQLRYVR